MNKLFSYLSVVLVFIAFNACTTMEPKSDFNQSKFPTPPDVEQKDCVLTIHEDTRIDPYFWMRLSDEQKVAETPDAQTQKVLDYLNAENDYTKNVLASTEDFQEELFREITGRIKKDDESVPYFKNGYYYYSKYEEGGEYPIHCRKKGSLDAEEEVMLDVNVLAEGYTYYSARGLSVSPDNKILAFGEDTVSRRVYHIRFLNLETGEYMDDKIENTSGSGAWANDNQTFFYTTKDKVSLLSNKIWRHKLGTKAQKDVLVHEEKDPSFYIGVYKSKSSKYIVMYQGSTITSDYQILDANKPEGEFKQFTAREADHLYEIYHFEDKFYILTNRDALNFKLMETSEDATAEENWTEVLAHRDDVLLKGVELFSNYMMVHEVKNALPHMRIIDQTTKEEHYLDFGEAAYVAYPTTNVEFDTETLRFVYSSMTTPVSTFDYNMKDRTKELMKEREVVGGHNPQEYVTERIYATAKDGEQVPMSLVYKKGLKKNGKAPTILYAYGSYGSSMDPWFSSTRLSLLDRGFVYAIAHTRGGQEMGRYWYEDGKLMNKINTFTDYIDCADYLIDNKYTSADHLYAVGGSAGGLLMGAIANMAPEKFNGIHAAVPFVDVVSTMLDETIPLTTNEFDEWGNPKEKDAYFYMLSYSPYDQVKEMEYPNMLVTTGLFDSQVQYWEPAKWVAKLRDQKQGDNLLIMHTNMEAGHGGASGRFKRYREVAMEYAFFLKLEGITE